MKVRSFLLQLLLAFPCLLHARRLGHAISKNIELDDSQCKIGMMVRTDEGSVFPKQRCNGAQKSLPNFGKITCNKGFPPAPVDVFCCAGTLTEKACAHKGCEFGYLIAVEGKRYPQPMCTNSGTSMEHGEKIMCKSGGRFDAASQADVYCCDGTLTTTECVGGARVVAPTPPPTPAYSEETKQCMAGDGGSWLQTSPGPIMMGGTAAGVTALPDYFRRVSAKSDEQCRAQCCESSECWGYVRKPDVQSSCWLLYQPTEEVGEGTSSDYYMVAKPEHLSKQRYPLALPYLVPLQEDTIVHVYDLIHLGGDEYYRQTIFDRETTLRSRIFTREDSSSYIAISPEGLREELRIFSGGLAESNAEQECSKLMQVAGTKKHLALCYGTGNSHDQHYARVEYVGREELGFASLPKTATTLLRSIFKQVMLAHLELIASDYILRDGKPSWFSFTYLDAEQLRTFGLASHHLPLKLTTMQGAQRLSEAAGTADAVAAALTTIYAVLSPEEHPLEQCVWNTSGANDIAAFVNMQTEDWLTEKILDCSAGEAGARISTFLADGGAKVLLELYTGIQAADKVGAAFRNALATPYLAEVESVRPDDPRIAFARAFDTCETFQGKENHILCYSGSKKVAKEMGCTIMGTENHNNYELFLSLCDLGDIDKDEPQPMCNSKYPLPESNSLRWGIDFQKDMVRASGHGITNLQEVCCGDQRNHFAAETPHFFESLPMSDDIERRLESGQDVTFRCSLCGEPLFTLSATKGRPFTEFKQESEHHGWPSFRQGEILWDNIASYDFPKLDLQELHYNESKTFKYLFKNNFETHCKTCGAHLGHNIADNNGLRLCIDVGCIAGNVPNGIEDTASAPVAVTVAPNSTAASAATPIPTAAPRGKYGCAGVIEGAEDRERRFSKEKCKCPKGQVVRGDSAACKKYLGKRYFPQTLAKMVCNCQRFTLTERQARAPRKVSAN